MTLGPATPQTLAVLRHPDQASGWIVVVAARLRDPAPVSGAPGRLAHLVPLTAARLRGEAWHAGEPSPIVTVPGDPLTARELWEPLRLDEEAPVRIVLGDHGRVALAAHHAAFDGLSLLRLLRLAAGHVVEDDAPPAPVQRREETRSKSLGGWLRRLREPADRVAPSTPRPSVEARRWQAASLSGPGVSARLAAAAVEALGDHNRTHGQPWGRVGISVAVAGERGMGNLASYRRVAVHVGDDVLATVEHTLAAGPVPPELTRAPRWLRRLGPLAERLGDSFLVSNLGRHELGSMTDVVFFPVARGPSAVAIGAVAGASGPSSISLRARHLGDTDAAHVLDDVIARLITVSGP